MMARIEMTGERMERVVMTDQRLDDLANRFVEGRVRELLGISFEHYMLNPDEFDRVADGLKEGSLALQRRTDEPALSVVEIRNDPAPTYGLLLIPLGRN